MLISRISRNKSTFLSYRGAFWWNIRSNCRISRRRLMMTLKISRKISRRRLIQLLMSKSKVSRSRRTEVLEKSKRNQGRLLTGLNAQRRIPTFLSWALTVSGNIEDDESLFNLQPSPAIERLEVVLLPLAGTCISSRRYKST